MKKLLFFASAATLVMASCSDEFAPSNNSAVLEGNSKAYVTFQTQGDLNTRTYLDYIGNGEYKYVWDSGDAIGVYNLEGYADNAMFSYKQTSDETGVFVSQINIPASEENPMTFYGYYPYDPTANPTEVIDNKSLSIELNAEQTFNYAASQETSEFVGGQTGSFANGSAPAVAVATTTTKGEVSFNLQPLASYLVVPMTGIGTVKSIELAISDVDLAGTYKVDLTNLTVPFPDYVLPQGQVNFEGTQGSTITLNCGNVQLNPVTPINFWFVVPTGIQLDGKTVTLTVNGSKDDQTITKTYKETTSPTLARRNMVRALTDGGNPFVYSGNSFLITNQCQFLEYAYASTEGIYGDVLTKWQGLNNTGYTWFEQMITEDSSVDSYELKPAVIAVPELNMDPTAVAKYLSDNGVGMAGGAYDLEPYYQVIYGSYISPNGGYINSFGPTVANTNSHNFGLSGDFGGEENAVLSNLKIKANGGNGAFSGQGSWTVSDITLSGITVDFTESKGETLCYLNWNYNTRGQNFDGVTVENAKVLPATAKTALFSAVSASSFNPETPGVENLTTQPIPFAYTLDVNAPFDFTKPGAGMNNFNIIKVTKDGAVMTIDSEDGEANATDLLDKIAESGSQTTAKYYHIVDDAAPVATSYWTGTVADSETADDANVYAENLAWAVRYPVPSPTKGNAITVDLTHNYNMMATAENIATIGEDDSDFVWFWWASSKSNVIVAPVEDIEDGITISNVYINGTDGNDPLTTNLSFFGGISMVNGVTIDGITIDNTGENLIKGAVISAVSNYPQYGDCSVNVKNMTVNADDAQGYDPDADPAVNGNVGGLYNILSQNSIQLINDCSFSWATTPSLTGINIGNLAGVLGIRTSGLDMTVACPKNFQNLPNLFGALQITVEKGSTESMSTVLTLTGFASNAMKEISVVPGNNTGIQNGQMIVLKFDDKTRIFQYNREDNVFYEV